MESRQSLQVKRQRINRLRQTELSVKTRVFHELLMFMDYRIRRDVKTFSILSLCGGERDKFMVDIYFQNAFAQLSIDQKVQLYESTVNYAVQFQKKQNVSSESRVNVMVSQQSGLSPEKRKMLTFRWQIPKGFGSWSVIYLLLDGFKLRSQNLFEIDLRNYLLRKSKKTERECYVLQAIHQTDPQTIRFSFLSNSDRNNYLPLIEELITRGYREGLRRMLQIQVISSSTTNGFFKMRSNRAQRQGSAKQTAVQTKNQQAQELDCRVITSQFTYNDEAKQSGKKEIYEEGQSVVKQIIKNQQEQYLEDDLANIVDEQDERASRQDELLKQSRLRNSSKQSSANYRKNVFAIIFPYFNLESLDHFANFKLIYNSNNGSCLFQNNENPLKFKMKLQPKVDYVWALKNLLNVPLYKSWHPQIENGHVNLRISSQNSAIVYEKHKAYSKWYRARDFLYLRHVFKRTDSFFIADKSIQNSNFIPFQTIQRGFIIYQIIKISAYEEGCRIIIECQIHHQGLLNSTYMQELTRRYLMGFEQLQKYCSQKKGVAIAEYFGLDWEISPSYKQSSSLVQTPRDRWDVQSIDFIEQQISCSLDEEEVYFSIKEDSESAEIQARSIHELLQDELIEQKLTSMRNVVEVIAVDEAGVIILPKTYLTVLHSTEIQQYAKQQRLMLEHQDLLRKNHWVLQDSGGFVLVNKQIIAAQDNVLSFIMSTLKKNIFSGKGGLNISLPVTIFNCDSNLQRLCYGLGTAPDYLQRAAKLQSQLERMKYCLVFGLTTSLLFVDIEKPFNPILGQTYQGFLAGCPVYAQQISHHPPVTAIYLIGRGYKVYGSLQGRVNVYVNSANGINLGWYHILFDDAQSVCFQTPPAQFSGLALGSRKFNFKQKGYYYDRGNQYYAQMKFEDESGMFSSSKWKFKDQFEVQLHKVTHQFLDKFISNFPSSKVCISKKDIVESYFKLEGRWPFGVTCEGEEIYSVNKNLPHLLVDYQYPLNSNSNYREDLYYRKKNDLSRSQTEKERLQIVQRQDKKLRQQYKDKHKN